MPAIHARMTKIRISILCRQAQAHELLLLARQFEMPWATRTFLHLNSLLVEKIRNQIYRNGQHNCVVVFRRHLNQAL